MSLHDLNPDIYSVYLTVTLTSLTRPLILRAPTLDDAPALISHFSDTRNTQHDRSVHGLDNPEAIIALIERWSTVSSPPKALNFVVEIEGEVVGVGGLGWIGYTKSKTDAARSKEDSSNDIYVGAAGIMLDTRVRGKGYAVEALRMIMDYAFTVLRLDEVRVGSTGANVAMKGLMENKFGLVGERIEPDQFGNEWVWRIRKDEWDERGDLHV